MTHPDPTRPFVVLQSFPTPRPTTNPYLIMLGRSIDELDDVTLRTFSWRAALTTRYDVFHVHWPEILVSGRDPVRKLVRQIMFVALLGRLAVTRTPLVRTAHNLELPRGISRREVGLLRLAERLTDLWITVNTSTEMPAGREVATIPHGHYRDWYDTAGQPERVPGRVAFFGLIRAYKNVDALLTAFRAIPRDDGDVTLHVSGRPSSDSLQGTLTELAGDDPRISLNFEFLTDAQLVAEVGASELVVLPYQEMHNSGGVLTALSLDRPVLVIDNDVNRRLRAEVGDVWVQLFTAPLTAEKITSALRAVRSIDPHARPDLGARDWDRAGTEHLAAYQHAVGIAHRHR